MSLVYSIKESDQVAAVEKTLINKNMVVADARAQRYKVERRMLQDLF